MFGRSTVPMGSVSSPVFAEGAGGSDPALSPLWRGLGRALTSLRPRLSFSKMKRVKQLSRDHADDLITNVRPGKTPGTYLGLKR